MNQAPVMGWPLFWRRTEKATYFLRELKRVAFNQMMLMGVISGGVIGAAGGELRNNQLMIGNKIVEGVVSNGTIKADRVMVTEPGTLTILHYEVTPLPDPASNSKAGLSLQADSGPRLRLLMSTGAGQYGRIKGFHGFIYMAPDTANPGLSQSNLIDILASEDETSIVVMVLDNGPIYTSTNSGMSWMVCSAPGKYQFPLKNRSRGTGFIAEAKIYPADGNQAKTNPPSRKWYAVAAAPDRSRVVISEDLSNPAPVLSIVHSGSAVVVSWLAAFRDFILQGNSDLNSTNWVDVPDAVTQVGDQNQVIISPAAESGFYRLKAR